MGQVITPDKAVELILASHGHWLTVTFKKRTTGEMRTMNCRLGVTKHLKGGDPAYDARAKGLICVYDVDAKGYRSISTESITTLVIDGRTYIVTSAPMEQGAMFDVLPGAYDA